MPLGAWFRRKSIFMMASDASHSFLVIEGDLTGALGLQASTTRHRQTRRHVDDNHKNDNNLIINNNNHKNMQMIR